jgi:hypothetical protein
MRRRLSQQRLYPRLREPYPTKRGEWPRSLAVR